MKILFNVLEVAVIFIPFCLGVSFLFRTKDSYDEKYANSKLKFLGVSRNQYAIAFRVLGVLCFIIALFAVWNFYFADESGIYSENKEFWDSIEKSGKRSLNTAMLFAAAIAIPARMASSRFPGKPLAILDGKPVLQRVYESCKKCARAEKIVILTDSSEIMEFSKNIGADCIMTSPKCASGTERIIEASDEIDAEFVVNVQGDEPFIAPELVDSLIELGVDAKAHLVTAASKITDSQNLMNPNVVKVLRDNSGRAIYFSRSPLPYVRGESSPDEWLNRSDYWRHIGIYGYSAKSLARYSSLPVSKMEKAEMLEQLRFISAGFPFDIVETEYESIGIDTPEDLAEAEKYLKRFKKA